MRNFNTPQYCIYGEGSILELGNILKPRMLDQASFTIFLIDRFFEGKELLGKLPIQKQDIVFFVDTKNEPYADYINDLFGKIKVKARVSPVAIVGIGGGSTIDIAKCIAVLFTNPGMIEDYQGWDLVKNPGIYKIAVPTISGTGAEVTRTAVITSKIQKLGVNSQYSVCDQVILDPSLLKTVPNDQFVWTAMDCYVHCVESLRGSMIDELSRAYGKKALDLVSETLLSEKPDLGKLMVASYFGGIAIANTNVGICHPLSYGLSLVLGLHHGISICIAVNQLGEYYPEAVEILHKILRKYNVSLPQNIMKNVSAENIDRMVTATLRNEKPLTNAFGENWRNVFTPEKVKKLFLKM